jgi:hypothetical protein
MQDVATSLMVKVRKLSGEPEIENPSGDDITITSETGENTYFDSDDGEVEVVVTTSLGLATGTTEATVTIEMFEGLDTLTAMTDALILVGTVFEPNSSITYTTTTNSTNGEGAEVTVWVDGNGDVYQVSISETGDGYMVGDSLLIGPAVANSQADTSYTSPAGEGVDSLPDVFSGVSPSTDTPNGEFLAPTNDWPPKASPSESHESSSGGGKGQTVLVSFPYPALPSGGAARGIASESKPKGYIIVVTSDATSIMSKTAKKTAGSKLGGSGFGNKVFLPIYQYFNPIIKLKAVLGNLTASSDFLFTTNDNVVGTTTDATATTFYGLVNTSGEQAAWRNGGLTFQDFVFTLEDVGTFNKTKDATDADFVSSSNNSGNDITITNLVTTLDNSTSTGSGTVSGTIFYNSFGTTDVTYSIEFERIFSISK